MPRDDTTSSNWVQILAALCTALALICFPIWWLARGEGRHGGGMIFICGVLFTIASVVLWLLGGWLARHNTQADSTGSVPPPNQRL